MLKFHPDNFWCYLYHLTSDVQFSCLNWRSSRVFLVSGAGSRGFDPCEGPAAPQPEPAQLSWMVVPLQCFSLMAFFWSERLIWPLLSCTCRTRGGIGRRSTAVPFSHPRLSRQFQHSPGAALSRCLAAPLAQEMEAMLVVHTPGGR